MIGSHRILQQSFSGLENLLSYAKISFDESNLEIGFRVAQAETCALRLGGLQLSRCFASSKARDQSLSAQ
jgi:hypothetical protein